MGCGCKNGGTSLGVLLQGYSSSGLGALAGRYGVHFPDDYNGAPALPREAFSGFGDLDPNAVLWPSRDILAQQTALLRDRVKQLSADRFNDPNGENTTQEQLGRWNAFVADLDAWDWGPAILAHIIDATWRDDLIIYQTKFNNFRNEWLAAGVDTGVPAFTFEAAPPGTIEKLAGLATKPLADAANTAKWIGIGAGVVAVGYLFFLTRQVGGIGKAIAPGLVRNPRRRRRRR